jgi:hypothetical protein
VRSAWERPPPHTTAVRLGEATSRGAARLCPLTWAPPLDSTCAATCRSAQAQAAFAYFGSARALLFAIRFMARSGAAVARLQAAAATQGSRVRRSALLLAARSCRIPQERS